MGREGEREGKGGGEGGEGREREGKGGGEGEGERRSSVRLQLIAMVCWPTLSPRLITQLQKTLLCPLLSHYYQSL